MTTPIFRGLSGLALALSGAISGAAAQPVIVDRWGLSADDWNSARLDDLPEKSRLKDRQAEIEAAVAAGDASAMMLAAAACGRAAWGPCDKTTALALIDRSAVAGNSLAAVAQAALFAASTSKPLPAEMQARLNSAAGRGNRSAMMLLALLARGENGGTRNPQEEFRWTKQAADAGESAAMFDLAGLYAAGRGVTRQPAQATAWYRKAAELGHTSAMNEYAEALQFGIGISKNLSAAMPWYRRAAEAGHRDAQYALGYCLAYCDGVAKDYPQALRWLTLASDAGDAEATTTIGAMHYDGLGVPVNRADAVHWYEKAAKQGSVWAKRNLGFSYFRGDGTAVNAAKGAEYFRQAAEGGNDTAMQQYAAALYHGNGVARDRVAAVKWYQQAAEKGNSTAIVDLGSAYLIGDGVAKNYPEALRLLKTGALSGSAKAYFNLAYMHHFGLGTPINLIEAARLYGLAQSAGHPDAAGNLASLRRKQELAKGPATAPTAFDIRKTMMMVNANRSIAGLTEHTMDFQTGYSRTTILGSQMEIRWTVTDPKCLKVTTGTYDCSYLLEARHFLLGATTPLMPQPARRISDRLVWTDGYWSSPTMIAGRRKAIAEQRARANQKRAEEEQWVKNFCIGNPDYYKC